MHELYPLGRTKVNTRVSAYTKKVNLVADVAIRRGSAFFIGTTDQEQWIMDLAITARTLRLRPLTAALAIACSMGFAPVCSARDTLHSRADAAAVFRPTLGVDDIQRQMAAHPGGTFDASVERPRGGPTVVVQNCNDGGPGSLREAYFNAVSNETIDLSQLSCSRITQTTALTDSPSAGDVTLMGPGMHDLTINGNHNDRVLVHNGGGQLTIIGLTVTGGSYSGIYGGGCIYSYADVILEDVVVSDCSMSSSGTAKANGGGIYAHGDVRVIASQVIDSSAHAASASSAGGGVWANRAIIVASTISGNTAVSGGGGHYARGGGVFAQGNADILYSTISDNQADSGGGLFLYGAADYLHIVDSTISGNRAFGAGGGVYAKYQPLLISNSTITQNTAGFSIGAGLYVASATEIQSTIIANNFSDGLNPSDVGGDVAGTISGSNNLIIASTLPLPPDTLMLDPMLGPLQDNGGTFVTHTHALLGGSPAIDHGNNLIGVLFDQRLWDTSATKFGYERVVGPSADIGAFESGAPDHIFVDGFDVFR